ncbi:hypothetical protein [Sutterella wadsworthensis]|uniref:hypothetical protein n=1 Tax=Sutterella wadsworthensis TaxID=40545 RepID=UPI003AF4D45D
MTGSAFHAVAPVSALCAAFAAQPSTYPPEAPKPDVAPTCGGCCGNSKRRRSKPAGSFRQKTEPQAAKPAENRAASGEAGESQGVVRVPWQTHLPAVRAVWDFRTGVVERAKTALLGSEAQIVPLFQGKQRGCAQNWRKIGMANKKIKFPLWLMPETKATVELLYRQDGCSSQSEFIEKAILFYCGYLQSEYAGDFLPKILGETLEAILSMFGDRIGKLLLKQAVEQNVCNHILASDTDIDAQTYQQMRGKSYQEVLRTNGQISFPEVLRQQSRL